MNMKFIRSARRRILIREKALDVLSKALFIGISVLVCLWMISGAHAAPASITGIKGQMQGDGTYTIDFAISQKVAAEDVAVEYERNFIQVSLKNVSAYPARTENLNEGNLERVFTYQYQPDLARARVLLKGNASALKGKSSWKVTADGVRVAIKGEAAAAPAIIDSTKSKAAAASADADDERIVQQILSESKSSPKSAPGVASAETTKKSEEAPVFSEKKPAASEDQAIFSPKDGASRPKESTATRVIASLLLVIGVIGACAVAFRRFAMGKGISFQRQNRVIETIATQSFGPKRSVAVIKVLDQYMVVGMAGDGMNLLANLGSDVKIDKYLDQIDGPGASFGDSLESALTGPVSTDTVGKPLTHKAAQIELGIRSSIKKRIAGFKPL